MQSQIMYYATKKIETEHYHLQQVFRKKERKKKCQFTFQCHFQISSFEKFNKRMAK